MSISCAVLVSLIPDGSFIVLTTTSRRYGKSRRFLMSIELAKSFLDGTNPVLYDSDLNNFLSVYYVDANTLLFRVFWLQNTGTDQLSGHQESFELPAGMLFEAINGNPGKCITNKPAAQCPIIVNPSAQNMIRDMNKPERRALSKALRDNWHWSHAETINLYKDWNSSFCFVSDTISGGLCRHVDMITGRDGKPRERIRYSVHT